MRQRRCQIAWILSAFAVLLSPSAWATIALPEVLLVVDTSASMQYRVGADQAPLCGSTDVTQPDQRSRWNALREMIGGTFLSYTCGTEPMATPPEALSPPSQTSGSPQCIPGLPAAVGVDSAVTVQGSGLSGGAGGVGATDKPLLIDALSNSDVAVAWFALDLSKIGGNSTVIGATLNLTTASYSFPQPAGKPVQPFYGLLVAASGVPGSNPVAFVNNVDGAGRIALSGPTVIQPTGMTQFALSDAGVTALQAAVKSGNPQWVIAVVPSASQISSSAANNAPVNGSPTQAVVSFQPFSANSSDVPSFHVVVGQKCPSEGPGTHAVAYGVQNDGTTGTAPTGMDGLLDVFGPMAKFALMAGDGVLNKGTTAAAGYSFGNEFASLWGSINLGMADPYLTGAPSVPIASLDDLPSRQATYTAIQSALSQIRPNGPTPLGAQLADTYNYLFSTQYQDPHFRSITVDPVQGDPYGACRQRIVVVISDGGANLHDGTVDGRSLALQQAALLYTKGVPVYVIAVGFPREITATGPSDADLQFLNDLAIAGGTQSAFQVATPQGAVTSLAPAIAQTTAVGQALSRPVYSTSTGAVTDSQDAFGALNIFDISQPLRTRGAVEERIFRCSAECKNQATPNQANVCAVVDFGTQMLSRGIPRRIYSHTSGLRVDADGTHLSADDLGIGTVGNGPKLVFQTDTSCVTAGSFNLALPAERSAYRDHVLDTMRGATGTCRQNWPLGAPGRSQPAILEPANRLALRDPSFLTYGKTTVPTSANYSDLQPPGSAGRATMLFVGTHDGLLHAFRTDADPKVTVKDSLAQGDEMWAWLPRFNVGRLSQMKLVTSAPASWLGGTVATGHYQLVRSGATAADAAAQWRAVVIVGTGESGSGYTALDVTAPDDPRLMWEITPESHCFGPVTVYSTPGPACIQTSTFQPMGRSTAKPMIATLFYAKQGETAMEHAVAIIPLGMSPTEATVSNLGVEGAGDRGLMILDLASGALIKMIKTNDLVTTGMPTVLGSKTEIGHFWSDLSCFNHAPGQIVTRCFVGDSKGVLWRLDLTSPDPQLWTLRYFFDAYNGNGAPIDLQLPMLSTDRVPVRTTPALSATAGGSLIVVYGTGSADDDATDKRVHMVYSLQELTTVGSDGSAGFPTALELWQKRMDLNERYVGPPLIFAGDAYWASYTVLKSGSCNVGTARMWGGRYDRPRTPGDLVNLQGAFPNPAQPAALSANLEHVELGAYQPSPVDIEPVPACTGSCAPTNPSCVPQGAGGRIGGSPPTYQLAVAVAGNVQAQFMAPKTGTQPQVGSITRTIAQPHSAAVVTGWDLLLD